MVTNSKWQRLWIRSVETAGFVLDAASTVLANKHDPHSIKVFDASIKGETDRFAYRFVRI
jgi:predicted methyltransferase